MRRIFTNTRIDVQSQDVETMSLYLQSCTSEKVEWRDFVLFFRIDGAPSETLTKLRSEIRNTGQSLDKIVQQNTYSFAEFHSMLARWIDVSKLEARSLQKVFALAQEGRKMDVRGDHLRQLLRASNFDRKKLETAPADFKTFVEYLVAQKVPIFGYTLLQGKTVVPVSIMHQVVDKSQYRGSRGWMNFFEKKQRSSEFDLAKLK